MQHIITCSTEELALLVTLCGYPSAAKSIAEASAGERSEQEWQAIMEVTAHQLMAKQYWDYEKEERGEIPLSEDMQLFIVSYVQSKYIIRCSNAAHNNVLLFHHIEHNSPWIVHIIERDIIHEFSYIAQEDIASVIRDYYDYPGGVVETGQQFRLTDEAFDLLNDESHVEKVRSLSSFSAQEETRFQHFLADLTKNAWTLNNISLFDIPDQEQPSLRNIVFFLPSSAGVWIVEYTHELASPVSIQLSSSAEWEELLHQVGQVELS